MVKISSALHHRLHHFHRNINICSKWNKCSVSIAYFHLVYVQKGERDVCVCVVRHCLIYFIVKLFELSDTLNCRICLTIVSGHDRCLWAAWKFYHQDKDTYSLILLNSSFMWVLLICKISRSLNCIWTLGCNKEFIVC